MVAQDVAAPDHGRNGGADEVAPILQHGLRAGRIVEPFAEGGSVGLRESHGDGFLRPKVTQHGLFVYADSGGDGLERGWLRTRSFGKESERWMGAIDWVNSKRSWITGFETFRVEL